MIFLKKVGSFPNCHETAIYVSRHQEWDGSYATWLCNFDLMDYFL